MKTSSFVWQCTKCKWEETDDPNVYFSCPDCGAKVARRNVYRCDFCHQGIVGHENYKDHLAYHAVGKIFISAGEVALMKKYGYWAAHCQELRRQGLRPNDMSSPNPENRKIRQLDCGQASEPDIRFYVRWLAKNMVEAGQLVQACAHGNRPKSAIFQGLEDLEEFVTRVLVYASAYGDYRPAIAYRENISRPLRRIVANHGLEGSLERIAVIPHGDLRTGQNGLFPGDGGSEPPYLPYPGAEVVERVIEEELGSWGFADTLTLCRVCGGVVRYDGLGPDDWVKLDTGEDEEAYFHDDCILGLPVSDRGRLEQRALEACRNQTNGLYYLFGNQLAELEKEYEYGLYGGQTDDPNRIIMALNNVGIDVWFRAYPGQWDTRFRVLVEPENEERAIEILNDPIAYYAGFDPAGSLRRALRGDCQGEILPSSGPDASILYRCYYAENPPRVVQRMLTEEEFVQGVSI